MSDRQKNIDAQKRWGEQVASNGKVAVLDDVLHPDFCDHDPAPDQGPGIDGLKDFFLGFRSAFPDLEAEVVEMVATDDHVTLRYNVSGTHQGDFMGFAPTGKRFKTTAMQLGRWKDGQCIERWGVTDQLKILTDLGLVQTPG